MDANNEKPDGFPMILVSIHAPVMDAKTRRAGSVWQYGFQSTRP